MKATQLAPNGNYTIFVFKIVTMLRCCLGIPIGPGDRCLSFDGDADRIVYFYCTAGTHQTWAKYKHSFKSCSLAPKNYLHLILPAN